MSPEEIAGKYGKRIHTLLTGICRKAQKHGWLCGPIYQDTATDEYVWTATAVKQRGGNEAVDVSIKIMESENWDGTSGGLNFGLSAIEVERGDELIQFVPYNYSEDVWVRRTNGSEVEARFRVFASSVKQFDGNFRG